MSTAMKPDILYLGRFPDATVAELHRRFTVHHFSPLPNPEAITAEKARGAAADPAVVVGRARAARFASISRLRATRNSQGRIGRPSALSWGR